MRDYTRKTCVRSWNQEVTNDETKYEHNVNRAYRFMEIECDADIFFSLHWRDEFSYSIFSCHLIICHQNDMIFMCVVTVPVLRSNVVMGNVALARVIDRLFQLDGIFKYFCNRCCWFFCCYFCCIAVVIIFSKLHGNLR